MYPGGADKFLARPGRKQARKHIRDARDFNNIETRAVIKFLFLQGKAPKEIHAILTEILAFIFSGRANYLSAPLYLKILRKLQKSCVSFEYLTKVKTKSGTFRPYLQSVIAKIQTSGFSGKLTHLYQCERPLNPEVPNLKLKHTNILRGVANLRGRPENKVVIRILQRIGTTKFFNRSKRTMFKETKEEKKQFPSQ